MRKRSPRRPLPNAAASVRIVWRCGSLLRSLFGDGSGCGDLDLHAPIERPTFVVFAAGRALALGHDHDRTRGNAALEQVVVEIAEPPRPRRASRSASGLARRRRSAPPQASRQSDPAPSSASSLVFISTLRIVSSFVRRHSSWQQRPCLVGGICARGWQTLRQHQGVAKQLRAE
jgi:hypothetical protein